MKKDFKEFLDRSAFKLHVRGRVKMRVFWINLAIAVAIWLLTFIPTFLYFCVWATGLSATMTYFAILGALGLWQLLNVVFFLVPALAAFAESRAIRRSAQ